MNVIRSLTREEATLCALFAAVAALFLYGSLVDRSSMPHTHDGVHWHAHPGVR